MRQALLLLAVGVIATLVLVAAEQRTSSTGEATHDASCPDINGDGVVDFLDVLLVLPWDGQTVPPAPPQVDLDGSGTVDASDFDLVFDDLEKITACQTSPWPPDLTGDWGFVYATDPGGPAVGECVVGLSQDLRSGSFVTTTLMNCVAAGSPTAINGTIGPGEGRVRGLTNPPTVTVLVHFADPFTVSATGIVSSDGSTQTGTWEIAGTMPLIQGDYAGGRLEVTGTGTNVMNTFDEAGATVEFANVTGAGGTIVLTSDSSVSGGLVPTNFQVASSAWTDAEAAYYSAISTAVTTGNITVCISYADANDDGIIDGKGVAETSLELLHNAGAGFISVSNTQDVVNNKICATVSSLSEFVLGIFFIDTDNDGMPDSFENAYLCLDPLVADAGADPDGDGRTNLEEFEMGTDPCEADTDQDGMPDTYENAHPCLDPLVDDAAADPDGDGRTNLEEFEMGSKPCVANVVGGIAELAEVAGTPLETSRSSGVSTGVLAGLAAAMAIAIALGGAAWYARKRRLG